MKRILTVISTVGVIVSAVFLTAKLTRAESLQIPALGIEVTCETVFSSDSERLQEVIDKPDTAARYGRYVMDHAGENFDGLWNIQTGDAVVLGERRYRCSFVTTGWSKCGIQAKEGTLPAAELYLCTCKPYGEEYEIYIVGVDKEE